MTSNQTGLGDSRVLIIAGRCASLVVAISIAFTCYSTGLPPSPSLPPLLLPPEANVLRLLVRHSICCALAGEKKKKKKKRYSLPSSSNRPRLL